MNTLSKIFLISLIPIISACDLVRKAEEILLPKEREVQQTITEQKNVVLTCGKGNIKEFQDKGWVIVSSEKLEVPCTWKTKKSRRGCNLELDKGCKITVPDKMGTETRYLLERQSNVNPQKEAS